MKELIKIPETVEPYVQKAKLIELISAIEIKKREADKIIIFDETDVEQAGVIIKEFSKLSKAIEDMRKKAVEPLNKMVKGINTFFKGLMSFEESEIRLRTEVNKFIQEQREKEQRELEETKELLGDVEEVIGQKLTTSELTTVKRKTWELVDLNQVPRDYLILNEKMIDYIRQKSNLEDESPIPGIKFTITETIRVK